MKLKFIPFIALISITISIQAQETDSVAMPRIDADHSVMAIEEVIAPNENRRGSRNSDYDYNFSSNLAYTYSANSNITLYTMDFNAKVELFKRYLESHKIPSGNITQNIYQYETQFEVRNSMVDSLTKFLNSLGYVTQSTYNKSNNTESTRSAKRTIEQNKESIKNLKRRIASLNDSKSEEINNLNNQIINYQNRIEEEEERLKIIERNKAFTYFSVDILDENSTPDSRNSRINWVRMPGISYQHLMIENAKPHFSAKTYQGASLKYLFTKGKSYFEIGVMKAAQNSLPEKSTAQDSEMYNEFFMVSFGQDFYSRNFGRGNRRWFNLYTGYQLGLTIPNRFDDQPAKSFVFTNLNVGLEIYKSKRILIDTRASYFLPLYDYNRNTRGILTTASFNFVF